MEQKTITVNGVEIIAHADGSITKPYYKKVKRTFGGRNTFCRNRMEVWVGDKNYSVHRIIAAAFLEEFNKFPAVDHIDGDPSNNRIDNLRMVTNRKNHQAFKKKIKGCSSQFRGVHWDKVRKKWVASCKAKGISKNIGHFHNEKDAAIARDSYAFSQGFHLEGLNFPENYSELTNNQ
jgi:hypothetical protein